MNLTIGANTIREIQLRDSEGNNLILDDLEDVNVQIRQYNRIIDSYAYPTDTELQPGTTNSKLKIEITKATSLKFKEGNVYARVIEDNDDATFVVDLQARYLPDYLLFYAVLTDTEYQSDDAVSEPDDSNWRGAYDASSGLYPSTGGTGTGGIPVSGNEWYVSVGGLLDVTGLGVIFINPGALLKYLGGDVTLPESWKVTQ